MFHISILLPFSTLSEMAAPPSPSLGSLLRQQGGSLLSHLSDVPPDTVIDLGSWDGDGLANAMRGSKAAELPWWQLVPMDRFVALIFRALRTRKDDKVMRALAGFLAQLVRTHDRHRVSFPNEVKVSAGNVWALVLELLEDEAPILSKHTVSIFRTLLPNALNVLDWARQKLLRCVLQFTLVGLQSNPSVSSTVICSSNGRVEAIAKCLDFPDLQVQETAIQILLCITPFNNTPETISALLPVSFHPHWFQLLAAPTTLVHEVQEGLVVLNWDRTDRASTVLSLPVLGSITTTTGYSAECDLNLAWIDVGLYSITCRHKLSQIVWKGPPPLEIRLSNVCGVHFAVAAESAVLHLELQFSCDSLMSILYGEQTDRTNSSVVHKMTMQLGVKTTDQSTSFQERDICNPSLAFPALATIVTLAPPPLPLLPTIGRVSRSCATIENKNEFAYPSFRGSFHRAQKHHRHRYSSNEGSRCDPADTFPSTCQAAGDRDA
jgi:hypothetical protein